MVLRTYLKGSLEIQESRTADRLVALYNSNAAM